MTAKLSAAEAGRVEIEARLGRAEGLVPKLEERCSGLGFDKKKLQEKVAGLSQEVAKLQEKLKVGALGTHAALHFAARQPARSFPASTSCQKQRRGCPT